MNKQEGYSLLELLIVLGIIMVLFTVALPNYNRMMNKAKVGRANIELHSLALSLSEYQLDNGNYPTNLNQLTQGASPYIRVIPRDPWNNTYQIDVSNIVPVVKSFGADGQAGGSGFNSDISVPLL